MIAALLIGLVAVLGLAGAIFRPSRMAAAMAPALLPIVAAGTTLSTPTNATWAGGVSREAIAIHLRVKTTTNVSIGSPVEYDTDDDHVKVAAADSLVAIGVVARNLTNPAWDGTAAKLTAEDFLEIIPFGLAAQVVIRCSVNAPLMGAQLVSDGTGAFKALQTDTAAHAAAKKAQALTTGGDGSSTPIRLLAVI